MPARFFWPLLRSRLSTHGRHWQWRSFQRVPHQAQRRKILQMSSTAGLFASATTSVLYPPLDESVDSLRLLVLHPGSWSDEIVCTTQADTFSRNPWYQAVSYEWGVLSPATKLVTVNGRSFEIPENLFDALRCLRDPDHKQFLWADSICINQTDDFEKADQVSRMHLVYRRAAEVLVWLGPHPAPGEVDLVKLSSWGMSPPSSRKVIHAEWWERAVPWLFTLMHEEYWKRTWIIQEIGEARRVRVCFGLGHQQSLPWESFVAAVELYRECFPKAMRTEIISRIEKMRYSKRAGEIYPLTTLVSLFPDSFCKEARDKVYAFIGMANGNPNAPVPMSYKKPLLDVYRDLMTFSDQSTVDETSRQIELVHMSALIRRLFTRQSRLTTVEDSKPEIMVWREELYNKVGNRGNEVHNITTYGKERRDWHFSSRLRETMCWLPSGPEDLEAWESAGEDAQERSQVRVKGAIVGKIEGFGPTVEEVLALDATTKEWKRKVAQHFWRSSLQKKVIALNERVLDIVGQEYEEGSISAIGNFHVHGSSRAFARQNSPRLFFASNGVLGVASSDAREGDLVIQFWNSSASAIAMPSSASITGYTIVGRSGILREGHHHDWDVLEDKSLFHTSSKDLIDLDMDIDTLTRLTLNTVNLPYVE